MPQLLLELFSEEIPARMQAGAARDLERMAAERLKAAGLAYDALTSFAGPRRLTLVVEGLPAATPDREEELKGPKTSAPDQALEGFLRKTGLTREQLTERDGVFFAIIRQTGQRTADLVPAMVDQIIRAFPWPKSMRWGSGSLRWVRPLKRIVCLFDGQVVPFEVDGIASGDVTEGHRFLGAGQPIRVRDFADYRQKLQADFVLLDAADRRLRILEQARAACHARGLELVDDDGLLDEVSGLAEWPTPILGNMDPSFLDLPPEVIRLSMKVHQKYFAVRFSPPSGGSTAEGGEGGRTPHALAPHFVVVANVEAPDGGRALADGNSRVLSARLNDARFFWDEDRKVGFEPWLKKLEGVTFHAKLGTMAERVARIAALAREIAPLLDVDPALAEQAARYAKADLASGMVSEFPELQGIMGGYYARATGSLPPSNPAAPASVPPEGGQSPGHSPPAGGSTREAGEGGLSAAVADAIRDHYKPQRPADTVPTDPLTVAVALADKLDTLVGFFAIGETPTGSKDPFALRRAALGVIRLVLESGARLPLQRVVRPPLERLQALHRGGLISADKLDADWVSVSDDLLAFLADRLKVLLRDQGRRHDLVDAVFALGDDDLVRIVRRVEALDAFLGTDDGANLLAGYKRASNILKAEAKKGDLPSGPAADLPGAPAEETALVAALRAAGPLVEAALEAEDFAAAMAALAALRGPVDAFFEAVLVNADVPAERDNRLRLLGQVRDLTGRVADFGQISG
ncbi:glycine--tRNA ligase subunit beta [Brevundimonas sp.]|uniref:glycine--tRNA ligase subunit beta n=1 Tax=Brevundimonas sp. TaxID=1871086 RepID=UPI0022C41904|nr:glycine--tRNA ligase subunit beta [Brevundimonas sp.]MCZ8193200.1 glycine--tRNA ligase subunit beta [Brevundimonas sp.]